MFIGDKMTNLSTKRTATLLTQTIKKKKKPTIYDVVNPVPGFGIDKDVAVLYRLIRSQPSPHDNWTSNDNTDINKQ